MLNSTSSADAAFLSMINKQFQKENNAASNGSFTPAPVATVKPRNKALVRLVGSYRCFNKTFVKDDKGESMLLIMPAFINNKSETPSILSDFIDKVLTRVFVPYTEEEMAKNVGTEREGKRGVSKFIYENSNDAAYTPEQNARLNEIYWNVKKCGTTPATNQWYAQQRNWHGQTIFVQNVIDRFDYAWHQEHKTTKLLVKSSTVKGNKVNNKEISLFSVGSGLAELADSYHNFDYDILMVPGAKDNEVWKIKNVSKAKAVGFLDEIKKDLTDEEIALASVNEGFTQEEQGWDPIDIDKFYHVTSAKNIVERLGKTIGDFDAIVGTTFLKDLQAQVKEAPASNATAAPSAEMKAMSSAPISFDEAPAMDVGARTSSASAAATSTDAFYANLD